MTPYVIRAFPEKFHLPAYYTTRMGGISLTPYDALNLGRHTQDSPEHVNKNWEILLNHLNWHDVKVFSPELTHSSQICSLEDFQSKKTPQADAIYVPYKKALTGSQAIAITTADCVPILLWDSQYHTRAAIHAGWKGTQLKVLLKSLKALETKQLITPSTVYLSIGPCISQDFYEIGQEVAQLFDPQFIKKNQNKLFLDIAAANMAQARSFGISPNRIYGPVACTWQDERFYSYRREKITGRMAAIFGPLPQK